MKKNIKDFSKIKKNLLEFVIDESWEITKEDAIKIATATLLIAWAVDVNAATQCVRSACWC